MIDAPKPKRLLSIGTDPLLFKEGSAVRERIRGYAKDWNEMHIIVSTVGRDFGETTIGDNVWVYPTRSRIKLFYPLHMRKLGRFIIRRRNITNITCQDPFLTAMSATGLQKECGLPLEIQVHTDIGSPNYPHTIGNKVRKALALSYLPKANSIRVVSERIKKYLMKQLGIAAAKITVRPIFVDTEKIKNAFVIAGADLRKKYPQFDRIVLMASRLTTEKNVGLALKAWKLVVGKYPRAGLIIAGSGPKENELRSLAGKRGIANSVVFEKWVDTSTLASYYKTSDVFLSTSFFEGYGMSLIEARAAGLPVVSTDVGIAPEIGAKIVNFEPRDIANALCDILRKL